MSDTRSKMDTIAGIDLGTTFSSLAVLNAIGRPEIVPNSEGERLTPSVIFFDEENSGIIRVGIEALHCRYLDPQRSVRWVKRSMGDTSYKKTIDGKDWSPVELSALILKKLKDDCSVDNRQIRDVVISVPAHFDEIRRKATMDAGALAGLNVVGIVNEPVATALYYATTCTVFGKVLIYDLGGGTFDVTIMDVKGDEMSIICSQGDHELGGIDFDGKILELMQADYKKKFGAELINTDEERAKLEDEAEDIKKTLSRRDVAKHILYGQAGSMKFEITRQAFEEAVTSLMSRIDILLEVALEEAHLKPSQIDKVLLSGGSSRMPIVQKRLEKMFGFAPDVAVNVDECVSLGAAIHAGLALIRDNPQALPPGIIGGLKNIRLTDVCNHSYGTICAPIDQKTGRRVVENRIILRKNTPLPCHVTKTFYTVSEGQTELEINITQGEDTATEYVNKIATHKLKLPPNRPAECPIRVTYSYDVNQRMHCFFEDVQSGTVLEVDFSIDRQGNMKRGEIEQKAEQFESLKVQ
jgi:molecular chaperone DnaK